MILAAGLTPAWQQIVALDALRVGEVNRAREFHATASGKVINVGLALHHLAAASNTLAVVGGLNGDRIKAEFAGLGASATWIDSATPTRICTTILDRADGRATELVENSKGIASAEIQAFLAAFSMAASSADWIVASGSIPAGAPDDFYPQLMARADGGFILDISGPQLLGALAGSPFLVKPNRDELSHTLERDLSDDAALLNAMRHVNQLGATWCVVTDGAGPVHATSHDGAFRFQSLEIDTPVNPIGCGDCFATGIAFGLQAGRGPVDSIQIGIAAASQNLEHLLPARLTRETVLTRAAHVIVEAV